MPFTRIIAGDQMKAVNVNQIIDALDGASGAGVPISLTAVNDATNFALTVQNDEPTNSRALNVLDVSGNVMIRVDSSGVMLGAPLNLPFGSITGGNIAASTITGANIAPATVTGSNIATGTIGTGNIAVNNVQNLVGQYVAVPTFSTTTLSTWVVTPIAATIACTGRPLRITGQVSLQHSAGAGLVMVAIAQNGTNVNLVGQFNSPGVNYSQQIAWTVYTVPSAGTYTFAVYVQTVNAGTLSIVNSVQASLYVTEELR